MAGLIASVVVATPLVAQPSTPVLVTQAVDNAVRTRLPGNVHPRARAEFDRGEAPPDLPLNRMLLVLKRSPEQESMLRGFIDDQQDKSSPSYHQWLTPEEFGATYGPADSDIAAVVNWLKVGGFEVTSVSTGRTVIEFSGTAGLVKQAFGTAIHRYAANGEEHWANASDPSIPTALTPLVGGIVSLHNFPRKPHGTVASTFIGSDWAGPIPLYTLNFQGTTWYGVGPSDFATIYNVQSLWDAGISGTGQTIAIVGQSDINIQDIRDFRSIFGLPPNDPQIFYNGPNPGIQPDEIEAVLDVSWSGAVAKNATVDYVVSASTSTTAGVDLSALYIVDRNLAPVMSESYGECESRLGNAANVFFNSLWQQAAVQGITVLISSGDGGPAGCDDFNNTSAAQFGLAVSGLASSPYNVAVGGTDFDQTPSSAPTYWNSTNNTQTGASAKSYIREIPWNESCGGFGTNQCTNANSNYFDIVAGSGGPSSCSTQDNSGACLSGYSKPPWQTGNGVPLDGVRDTPDISLFASNRFHGSFYMLCEADILFPYPCSINPNTFAFLTVGGTSASSPAFAGIMALVNQKTGSRQGNANYVLYKLAAQTGNSCNSSTVALTGNSCIFYDTTKGNNSVPCFAGSPNCGPPPASGGFGVLVDSQGHPAWTTATGYDMATGLGSVNAANLVNKWNTATFTASTTSLTSLTPVNVTHGQPVSVSITVAPKTGTGTPTGNVTLMGNPNGTPLLIDYSTMTNGAATWTTNLLPGGTYKVTAHYAGDGVYGGSDSTPGIQVTVGKEDSQAATTLLINGASTTTVDYGTIYSMRSDVFSKSAGSYCSPSLQAKSPCPGGTVSYLDNGTPLSGGPYTLNFQGYEIASGSMLNAGSHTLGTQYSGDNSFNASTTNQTITVNQTGIYNRYLSVPNLVIVGQPFTVSATFSTLSYGLAPSGTVTFRVDGNPLPGTVQLTSQNGNLASNTFASLGATLSASLSTPGYHNIDATYSGDTNYLSSSTYGMQTDAQYSPAYFTLTANQQSVAYGDSVTLTAILGSSSKTLAPTGQISFQTLQGPTFGSYT
ncbi:MAG: Ig-like domain repeat protein, partial [Limisphaerales bacterium]